jgi:hypothetical protein
MKYMFGIHRAGKIARNDRGAATGNARRMLGYGDHLRAKGYLAAGEGPPEIALTLSSKNGKVATTDGPYAETKEQLGGILLLEARDPNHAIQHISQHPGGEVWPWEIRPARD